MRCRFRYRRSLQVAGRLRCTLAGRQGRMPLRFSAPRNQSASYPSPLSLGPMALRWQLTGQAFRLRPITQQDDGSTGIVHPARRQECRREANDPVGRLKRSADGGRPRPSDTMCNPEFGPPLLRPMARGLIPPSRGLPRFDAPSGGCCRSRSSRRLVLVEPSLRKCARTRPCETA